MQLNVKRVAVVLAVFVFGTFIIRAIGAGFSPDAACVGNSRLLYQAVIEYTQDYDEALPPMTTVPTFQTAVSPYVQDPAIFVCPSTSQPYVPNAAIAGDRNADIGDVGLTMLFQDSVAHDGSKTVTFFDGHVERNGVEQGGSNAICVSRMRSLGLGLIAYTQDYDERLPFMDTQAHFQACLLPYVRNMRSFTCPSTNQLFVPNSSLSGVRYFSFPRPSTVAAISDPAPHPDGYETICYLDGHVTHGSFTSDIGHDAGNLQRIGLGLLEYVNDYYGNLPPASNYSQFQTDMQPYLNDGDLFFSPDTGLPYVYNSSISGQKFASFPDPSQVQVLRDALLNNDGSFNQLYLDSHIGTYYLYEPALLAMAASNQTLLLWSNNAPSVAGQSNRIWTLPQNLSPAGTSLSFSAGPNTVAGLAYDSVNQDWILTRGNNTAALWVQTPQAGAPASQSFGPYDGWTAEAVAVGPNHLPRVLWTYYDGTAAVWLMSQSGQYQSALTIPAQTGKSAIAMSIGADKLMRVLWAGTDGSAAVTTLSSNWGAVTTATFPGSAGRMAVGISLGTDNKSRVLLANADGSSTIWVISGTTIEKTFTLPAYSGFKPIAITQGADGYTRVLWKNIDGSGRIRKVSSTGTIGQAHDFPAYQ